MKVRMKVQIGGFNGGEPWPGIGGVVDVTATEAADMIASGYAEPAEGVTTHEEAPDDNEAGPAASDDAGVAVPDDSKPARKRAARKTAQ